MTDKPLSALERAIRVVFAQYVVIPDDRDGPRVVVTGYADEAAAVIAPKVQAALDATPAAVPDARVKRELDDHARNAHLGYTSYFCDECQRLIRAARAAVPDALDVERLAYGYCTAVHANRHREPWCEWGREQARVIAREYALLATPTPHPEDGGAS